MATIAKKFFLDGCGLGDFTEHQQADNSPMSLYVAAKNTFRDNIIFMKDSKEARTALYFFCLNTFGINRDTYLKQKSRYKDLPPATKCRYDSTSIQPV